ncbi:acyl-CoA dehydrogenase family protein [Geminicoccaceae bacterium 1502E]|nr:acyl-CoA dehydrogenase family protein [Geminicoccaceae bacterium 1502E]
MPDNSRMPPLELGQDHAELREAVARLCARFDGAYWRALDRDMAYPEEFVRALSEAGYLGALVPEEYGGAGLPLRAASVILETIHAEGCNAAACHAQMYVMGTVLRHGSEEQKRRYLPGIASGALRLQAFGVTEPTSGSDTLSLKTRAVRRGDRYVVNGQKVWTSRAAQSDLLLLLARTTPAEEVRKRGEGLSVFLVDMREAVGRGLEIRPIEAMINHNTTELFFDDLEIPADSLVGEEGKGFRYILDGMNAERILIASECLGDSRWLIGKASAYAGERKVFGRPIGQNQGIQFPIARAYAETEAAELMIRKAAALFDAGLPCGPEANMAKLLASEASWHAAEAAMQTHGGFAFATEYDVERKWRETRLYQIAPVSTNLILAFLAHQVLGLPKSY